eukprot:TRINITY_DN44678_c0_g1_i1.p1 TRINITY_DN44678_c0_g1~~TRINITY_DN44678_c0_g1_i1.p1  ORF type:complete len:332 (-),score=57.24 TRINITY_DN44678_c0_g1_i1:68-1063(-)
MASNIPLVSDGSTLLGQGVDKLKDMSGIGLLKGAGCSLLANVSDPAVERVMEQKGLPVRGVVLLGPPSDSTARAAMYVVKRGLHKDGRVRMVTMSFVNDLNSEWFGILTGGRREVPVMLVDGQVVGESIPMIKVLMTLFPDAAEMRKIGERGIAMIDEAEKVTLNVDALVKHFGSCRLFRGAKDYRQKGATSGAGLDWVKAQLAPVHAVLTKYESILKDSKFLFGEELSALDCATCPNIGSLYHFCAMPVPERYPNCWRYHNDVKKFFENRQDWPDVSSTGIAFLKYAWPFSLAVKVMNFDRRFLTRCGCTPEGPEDLSNPIYWRGIDDRM